MKIIFFLSVFCISIISNAQDISAKYLVSQTIENENENTFEKKNVQLDFDGSLYKKGSIYISFIKPLYLNKYPLGYIENSSSNNNSSVIINMDSIQYITYTSIDSLVRRQRINSLPHGAKILSNTSRQFDINFQNWNILPDVKTIQGLKCQRAKWIGTNGILNYDVWFCADIPTEVNFNGLIGLPGLVIEGECIPWRMKFELISYDLNTTISEKLLWPDEFNEGFRTLGAIKKRW